MATLLHLPSELLSNILQSVTASSDATTQIRDLLSIAKTCSALHYAVFCDDILWRSPAIALGISPTTHLEDILYPGSSALAQRRWFNVVKLNYMWLQEFPDASATLPSKRKAVKFFPAESKNKGGKRTVEMCVAGLGAPPVFITAHAVSKLRGKALFNVIRANSGNLTGGVLDLSSATTATGAVVSKPPPRGYCKLGQPGYVIEREDGVHTVCELGVEEPGRVLRRWNIGKRDISVFRARGDMLVALVCSEPPSGHVATKMACMRAEGGDTEASILWECDISEDWKHGHQSEPFTQVHDFQLNSTHVVCLLGRYRDPMFSKLKVTQFRVMGLHTGEFCQSINFRQSPLSKHPPVHLRRALTTAFEHDFLLTDKFCVSGGHGGELLVWDYLKSGDRVDNLLYCIPVWCPGRSEFLRTFTALTVSADGRYIGATTSDQLFVVDMVAKTVHARYSNGRRIKDGVQYSKNPNDGFPAGMWCWWKEWDGSDDAGWKEVDSGVAYLCEIEEDEDVQTVSDQDENTLPTVSGQEKNTSQMVSDVMRWKQAHSRCKGGVVITTITTITTTYGPNPSLWGFSVFVLVIAVCFGLYLWGVQTVERGF